PALRGSYFGDVDVEVADRVCLELALYAIAVPDVREPRDAVPLQAAVQGRARQMRDRRLKGIQAVVERQQRMLAKRDDGGVVFERQGRRLRVFRAGRQIRRRAALLPLGDGLLIDAVAPGQRS